ncbi:helix-turn-helix transcriptional regulator [Nitrospirillum amazonense]|uniref:helix-turn-helix transcriptional regulator n=1 Tax=Nitrospirillum amazonense TaxID=28077 RepID=UPI0024127D02|nr:LuxR family transcriptional regulator [Nitrospirillum amazonense]MDG3444560.1 LuxR family transcriptional regulator [Nitrospirillum amazonense]
MELETTLDLLMSSSDPEHLFRTFSQIASNLGFSAASYVDTRPTGIQNQPELFVRSTARPDFVDTYLGNSLGQHDPLMLACRRSAKPMTWADVPEFQAAQLAKSRRAIDDKGVGVMVMAADHGYTQGYVIPAHTLGPDGSLVSAVVSMFWSDKPEEMLTPGCIPPWFRHIALTFHERIADLRLGNKPDLPKLTSREQECLRWAATGKTVSETAEILGVTARTITFHIDGACQKFNAYSKIQCVARAIQSGLISI